MRAAADEQRRSSLEESLIGGQFGRYASYRLRYVLLSRGLGMVVHVVEFALLSHVFASADFAASLAVQNAAALIAAFWWGALELHRNRVREGGGKMFVTHETGRWMGRAAIVSAALLVVAGAVVAWRGARRGGVDVVDAYALVVCGRLAIDLVARAFYSGVYARRRVYRPLPAIVFTELVSLVAVLGMWPLIGAWSFPAALAVSIAVSRGLLIYYTAQAYDQTRTPRPRPRLRRALRFRRARMDAGVVVWAGIANTSARIGSALVLVLLLQDAGVASQLAVVLHLVAPLLATAASWAQVFYLDFRKLEAALTAPLRRRLASYLVRLAVGLGAALWAVGAGIVAWQAGHDGAVATVFLLPVFIAAAILGQLQLRYFAEQQYRRVAAGALALGCGLVTGLGIAELSAARPLVSKPLAIAAAMGLATLVIVRLRGRRVAALRHGLEQSLVGWLAAVTTTPGPVRIASADLRAARHDQASWVTTWIAERLGQHGVVYLDPSRRVVWLERSEAATIDAGALVVCSGGLVGSLAEVHADTAEDAVREAGLRGLVPAHTSAPSETIATLLGAFRERFADGRAEDLRAPRDQGELRTLSPAVRRSLWLEAVAEARGARGAARSSGYDVTTYVAGGELAILFAVPRDVDSSTRRAWREHVRGENLAGALAPATRTAE